VIVKQDYAFLRKECNMSFTDGLSQVKPRLIARQTGGWLAISEPGSVLSIGVTAETEDVALARFALALKEWVVILDRHVEDQI
jgi:hypothetical protein